MFSFLSCLLGGLQHAVAANTGLVGAIACFRSDQPSFGGLQLIKKSLFQKKKTFQLQADACGAARDTDESPTNADHGVPLLAAIAQGLNDSVAEQCSRALNNNVQRLLKLYYTLYLYKVFVLQCSRAM